MKAVQVYTHILAGSIKKGVWVMDRQEILSKVDHTILYAYASWEDIQRICKEAIENKTASVCIPPCYVSRVRKTFGDQLRICTVVGFPLGYSVTSAKLEEARAAVRDGADEIDMVINIADVKNGDYEKVTDEIRQIKECIGDKILKVIIETCYLSVEEKIAMCSIVTEAKADFIKTSTGFGTGGATLEDIKLMKKHIGPDVKIKAAGGIRTVVDMEAYISEGCARLGSSSAVKILNDMESGNGY